MAVNSERRGELLSRVLVLSVASLGCSAGVGQCAGQHRSPGGLGTAASSALRSLWCVEQLQHYCSYLSAAGLTHLPHTPQPREASSTELLTPWRDQQHSVELCGLSSPGSRFSGRRCGQRGWVVVRAAEEPRCVKWL
ncbi:hypothetical protein SRHO_G00136520 [Serrasalmus rhombeus]